MYIKPYYLSSEKRVSGLNQRFNLALSPGTVGQYIFRLVLNQPEDREILLPASEQLNHLALLGATEYLFNSDDMDALVRILPDLSVDWKRFNAQEKPLWKMTRKTLDFSQGPFIMGILNVTPDSFSDGGSFTTLTKAMEHALQMEADGAHIIDIGGESTRPGADAVTLEEELERTIPVIREIRRQSSVLISIDTYKSEVAKEALNAGADIINDISGATFDSEMIPLVRQARVPFIAMHIKGTPKNMQSRPEYVDVVDDVYAYFYDRKEVFRQNNLSMAALDPGIGFGKLLEHNLLLLRDLKDFQYLGFPLLIGLSRKSMIGQVLDRDVDERLSGSIAANILSWLNGADIIRVHDVRETADALNMAQAILQI